MELTKTTTKYKQTEIGLIPEDWEVMEFQQLGSFFKGKGIRKDEVSKQGLPCIRYGELYTIYNNVIINPASFISEEIARQSFELKYGDLLFAGSGETKEEIGKSAVILRENTYAGGDIVVFRPKNMDSKFLGYLSNSKPINKQKTLIGQGDAVVHIYSSGISKIKIPLPPLPEQKAIAQVLSDTDTLIQTLEQKLVKKRVIKQGAMQQLLTPNPDSNAGDWEVRKLGEIAKVIGGGTPSSFNSAYWNGNINWFTPTEIGKQKYVYQSKRKITKEGFLNSSAQMLPPGTILLTSRAGIGDLAILKNEASTNQGFQSLIANDNINNEFLYYLLGILKPVLIQNASGSTFLEISPGKLKNIDVTIPHLKEQTRIATILSDMDAEIAQLEQKLDKYKLLKQGLMQELLTGRIRLI